MRLAGAGGTRPHAILAAALGRRPAGREETLEEARARLLARIPAPYVELLPVGR